MYRIVYQVFLINANKQFSVFFYKERFGQILRGIASYQAVSPSRFLYFIENNTVKIFISIENELEITIIMSSIKMPYQIHVARPANKTASITMDTDSASLSRKILINCGIIEVAVSTLAATPTIVINVILLRGAPVWFYNQKFPDSSFFEIAIPRLSGIVDASSSIAHSRFRLESQVKMCSSPPL
jgi:hypothetical protein